MAQLEMSLHSHRASIAFTAPNHCTFLCCGSVVVLLGSVAEVVGVLCCTAIGYSSVKYTQTLCFKLFCFKLFCFKLFVSKSSLFQTLGFKELFVSKHRKLWKPGLFLTSCSLHACFKITASCIHTVFRQQ